MFNFLVNAFQKYLFFLFRNEYFLIYNQVIMSARINISSGENQEKDFYESWGFPSEILTSINGAAYFKTKQSATELDKNGNPIFITYFLNKNMSHILSKRRTLRLLSKKTGNNYCVCSRTEYVGRFTPEEDNRLDAALDKLLA